MRRNNRVFRGGQVARPKRRDQPAADAEGEYSFPGVVRALSGAALGVAGHNRAAVEEKSCARRAFGA